MNDLSIIYEIRKGKVLRFRNRKVGWWKSRACEAMAGPRIELSVKQWRLKLLQFDREQRADHKGCIMFQGFFLLFTFFLYVMVIPSWLLSLSNLVFIDLCFCLIRRNLKQVVAI